MKGAAMGRFLRTVLIAFLVVLLLVLAVRLVRVVFTLAMIAVAIVGVGYAVKRLWRGGRSKRAGGPIEACRFRQRFPHLARLERRIQALETVVVDKAGM